MISLLLALGCAGQPPAARLPDPGGELAPAMTRAEVDGATLADLSACAACHPAEAAEHAESAHAFASFDNPWYRAAVDSFRAEAGAEASRMCGGCHDLALLVDGALDDQVVPGDARAHAGVGCLACHGSEARPDGNGSLTLHPPVLPDGDDVVAHVAAMRRSVGDPTLCVACHRGFLSEATGHAAQLMGMDEGAAWAASPWAGSRASVLEPPVPEQTCIDCHMADGHRFPGGQTALAAQVGPAALDAVQGLLQDAATLHLGALWIDGEPDAVGLAALVPGQLVELDVVIHNSGTGHRFPGGLKDSQAVELRVEVGDQVAPPWRLGSVVVDARGQPEWAHRPERFAAEVADATVPARGARAVRYRFEVPDEGPLVVRATLVHRRHVDGLADLACEATDPAFAAPDRVALDGCAPQPELVIAETRAVVGQEAAPWAATFALALALSGDVTEELARARAVVDLLEPGDELQQAQVHWLLGRIAARQGRVEEALAEVAAAEALVGPHPALSRVRGDALARVWRWEEALPAYEQVAEAAPRDTQAWRDLARAAGSVGDADLALAAARRGLLGAPRHHELLSSQAFALEALGLDAEAATEAWLAARPPDAADTLAATCEREVPGCRDWRRPVPVLRIE